MKRRGLGVEVSKNLCISSSNTFSGLAELVSGVVLLGVLLVVFANRSILLGLLDAGWKRLGRRRLGVVACVLVLSRELFAFSFKS